jgi:galactokinase
MVACARQHPACYGARMTGGGFGGCAVALIDADAADAFAQATADAYRAQTGLEPQVYVCAAAAGASVVAG